MKNTAFQPGFRVSTRDICVIALAMVAGVCAPNVPPGLGWVIVFVTFHFFLFCNVFRIARHLELVWALLFLVLTACTLTTGKPDSMVAFGTSFLFAFGLIAWHMGQPSYHGIGWQKLNPALPLWWQAQALAQERGRRA
jgi:hypothetical protein